MNGAQDSIFRPSQWINCGGRLVDLSRPKAMGIINVTPDSFHDGGKTSTENDLLQLAEKHLNEGAVFLDIGGVSTRPGAALVTEKEEWGRLKPAIETIANHFPEAVISVDTFRAAIARKSIEHGAHLINDIGGGDMDPDMFEAIADLKVPYILMHMQGTPENMQENPHYENVVQEVFDYLLSRAKKLTEARVHDIILDPGFGFGKNLPHNFELLRHLEEFKVLGMPILVGVSRKSMVNRLLKTTPQTALNGTTAIHMLALQQGAKILRVHDVREAVEAISVYEAFLRPEVL